MSPPALSRHLRVLRRAGLIIEDGIEEDGRVRIHRLAPNAFTAARAWIEQMEQFWVEQLDAFKAHAQRKAGRTPRPTRGRA